MADNITRCPECGTAFRISDAHLKSAKGVVRCGSCLSLFNARDHLEIRTPKPEAPATRQTTPISPPKPVTAPRYGASAIVHPATSLEPSLESNPESNPEPNPWKQERIAPGAASQETGPGGVERRRMPRSTAHQSLLEPKPQPFPSTRPVYEEPKFSEPAFEYPPTEDNETDDPDVEEDEAWALELLKEDDSDLNVQFKKVVPVVSSTGAEIDAISPEKPIEALDEELDKLLGDHSEPQPVAAELPEPHTPPEQEAWSEPWDVSSEAFEQAAPEDQQQAELFKQETLEVSEEQLPELAEEQYRETPLEPAIAPAPKQPSDASEAVAFDTPEARPPQLSSKTDAEQNPASLSDPPPKTRATPASRTEAPIREATPMGLLGEPPAESLEQPMEDSREKPLKADQGMNAAAKAPLKKAPVSKGQPLDRATLKNMLAAIEPDPMEVEFPQDQKVWYKRMMWPGLMLAAALLLTIQVAWLEFDRLSRIEPYRSFYGVACSIIHCELPELKDRSLIQTSNLVVRSHPELADTLAIDVILQNNAPFEQTFPTLQLTFTDLQGEPVAIRRFGPEQYLGGELLDQDQMPLRQPIHIAMEIVDPGPAAVNYNVIIVD